MTEPTEESDFVREIGMCFSPGGRLARNCPGFVSRSSQIAFAKIVARALENRETAVLEAGTGTGKTFAYLAPVLLSGRKAIVSTAGKTLQEQLFNKDFLSSYKKNIAEIKDYVSVKDGRFSIKKKYIYTMDQILLSLLKLPEDIEKE